MKYEEVYLHDYENFEEAREGLEYYFEFYNRERRHSRMERKTRPESYWGEGEFRMMV